MKWEPVAAGAAARAAGGNAFRITLGWVPGQTTLGSSADVQLPMAALRRRRRELRPDSRVRPARRTTCARPTSAERSAWS
jgi:hypothetical protein